MSSRTDLCDDVVGVVVAFLLKCCFWEVWTAPEKGHEGEDEEAQEGNIRVLKGRA